MPLIKRIMLLINRIMQLIIRRHGPCAASANPGSEWGGWVDTEGGLMQGLESEWGGWVGGWEGFL